MLVRDIGDKVRKGDVLFELYNKDLQFEKSSRKTEIAGANLAVQTMEIHLEKSKLAFDRVQDLPNNKLVAQQIFDNARLDYNTTENSLAIARGAALEGLVPGSP